MEDYESHLITSTACLSFDFGLYNSWGLTWVRQNLTSQFCRHLSIFFSKPHVFNTFELEIWVSWHPKWVLRDLNLHWAHCKSSMPLRYPPFAVLTIFFKPMCLGFDVSYHLQWHRQDLSSQPCRHLTDLPSVHHHLTCIHPSFELGHLVDCSVHRYSPDSDPNNSFNSIVTSFWVLTIMFCDTLHSGSKRTQEKNKWE